MIISIAVPPLHLILYYIPSGSSDDETFLSVIDACCCIACADSLTPVMMLCVCVISVARPPLPVYGIAVVGTGGIALLVALVILVLLLWKKWSIVRHKARRYSVSQGV